MNCICGLRIPTLCSPAICRCGMVHEFAGRKCGEPMPKGPGTHLKELLDLPSAIGLTLKTADCQCDRRAAEMNANGVEWCRQNTETIVGWLREGAEHRGILFVPVIARMLVREAIRRAAHD